MRAYQKTLRTWTALLLATVGLMLTAVLSGCHGAADPPDGPKPGELRTTDGKPAPPEAANMKGDAPPSDMPPPGQSRTGKKMGRPGGGVTSNGGVNQ